MPPFGANGVEFNNEYTQMYVANTAYHSIVEVPVILNPDGSVSVAGQAQVLTTGINAPAASRSTDTTISGSWPISRTRST